MTHEGAVWIGKQNLGKPYDKFVYEIRAILVCVCGGGGGEADINPVYMPTENMYQVEHIRNKGKILKQLFESVNPAVHVHASWMFVIHPLLLLWRGPKNIKERYECDRNRVF